MESSRKPLFYALGAALLVTGIAIADEISRNEAMAIGALRTINTQEVNFRDGDKENDGNNDYGMLSELSNTGLIDAVLGSGTKNGYLFEASYSPTTSEFLWCGTASPQEPGKTGKRYFYINMAGVIFWSNDPIVLTKKEREECSVPKGLTALGRETPPKRTHESEFVLAVTQLAGVERTAAAFASAKAGTVYVMKGKEGDRAMSFKIDVQSKDEKGLVVIVTIGQDGKEDVTPAEKFSFKAAETDPDLPEIKRKVLDKKEKLTVSGTEIECEAQDIDMRGKTATILVSKDHFPFLMRLKDSKTGDVVMELTEIKSSEKKDDEPKKKD